jgi:hypothetical protein
MHTFLALGVIRECLLKNLLKNLKKTLLLPLLVLLLFFGGLCYLDSGGPF